MNIGFDGSRAFIKNKTGTENYSYQLLRALSKIDRKNKYLIFLRDGLVVEKFPQNFFFKTIKWSRFWTQGGLALQTFKENLDVLFVPAHTLPVIRKPGLKTVVTLHDLGSEYLPSMHQLKQRLYLSFMQKYQLKKATKIITVSKATKVDLIKRIGIDQNKIKVIYEGYDKKLFKPINPAKQDKNDILVNSLRYFMFVGTIQPRKNLTRLIESFYKFYNNYKDYNGYKLFIVGKKGWYSDTIYKLPKKLGIEDRVKFLGYVPDEKLHMLYSGAIALVFPSLFEGFGLPILEAQACGCPVITSNISSMPEVAGAGAILVDPYNIDDIVDGMERVKKKEEREKLIKKGFENVKKFSWEKCAKETLEVLQTI